MIWLISQKRLPTRRCSQYGPPSWKKRKTSVDLHLFISQNHVELLFNLIKIACFVLAVCVNVA